MTRQVPNSWIIVDLCAHNLSRQIIWEWHSEIERPVECFLQSGPGDKVPRESVRVVQIENSLYDPRIKYRQVEVRDAGYDWSNTRRHIWRNADK